VTRMERWNRTVRNYPFAEMAMKGSPSKPWNEMRYSPTQSSGNSKLELRGTALSYYGDDNVLSLERGNRRRFSLRKGQSHPSNTTGQFLTTPLHHSYWLERSLPSHPLPQFWVITFPVILQTQDESKPYSQTLGDRWWDNVEW
jgi:hypothetical protein